MEALLLQRAGVSGVPGSGARLVPDAVSRPCSVHLKPNVRMFLGSVRFVGSGGHVRYLRATPDGNAESLEQAEAESASTIDAQQEPFRDSVESGQTIGEATTAEQFGENDGKSAGETVTQASKELYQQSKANGKSEPSQEKSPEDEEKEVSSDVWGSKEKGGTHDFLDDSEKIDFQGQDDESVFGIGGQRAGESQM